MGDGGTHSKGLVLIRGSPGATHPVSAPGRDSPHPVGRVWTRGEAGLGDVTAPPPAPRHTPALKPRPSPAPRLPKAPPRPSLGLRVVVARARPPGPSPAPHARYCRWGAGQVACVPVAADVGAGSGVARVWLRVGLRAAEILTQSSLRTRTRR